MGLPETEILDPLTRETACFFSCAGVADSAAFFYGVVAFFTMCRSDKHNRINTGEAIAKVEVAGSNPVSRSNSPFP